MHGVIYCGFDAGFLIKLGVDMIGNVCDCAKGLLEALQTFPIMETGNKTATIISSTATTIATLLVVIELCSQAMGFHFDDINDAVRFAFKVVVFKIIIENSSRIVNMVYGMFMHTTAWFGVTRGFVDVKTRFATSAETIIKGYDNLSDDSFLEIKKFFIGVIFVFAAIIVVVLCIMIIANIAGLIFELCINIAIAPAPIATLVNSQTRSIGINFIKSFSGNCLTLTMYQICFTVYKELATNIQSSFGTLISNGSDFSAIGIIVPEIVGLLLLSVAVKNVGTMINKVLS